MLWLHSIFSILYNIQLGILFQQYHIGKVPTPNRIYSGTNNILVEKILHFINFKHIYQVIQIYIYIYICYVPQNVSNNNRVAKMMKMKT